MSVQTILIDNCGTAIRPSVAHPRYFAACAKGEDESGAKTYIPIGINLCFPRFDPTVEAGIERYESWLDALAKNRGNFARLWLGHPFFDIEPHCAGEFDEGAAARLDKVLEMAKERGILIKMTLEHFRTIDSRVEAERFPGAASFSRLVYALESGGIARDMRDFLDNPKCRALYLKKLDWLAERYAGHPAIFGWELWNEMNAVDAPNASWLDWTQEMLFALRTRFPGHLVMQSLGSYDSDAHTEKYVAYTRLEGADLVQVHRYLDPGAPYGCCQGAMDVLCADAVTVLRQMAPAHPVLLAECGAVEVHHTAPSHLYGKDREGVMLHDEMFSAFFAGSAGVGQAWHWDYYVERNDLWHHFASFAQAVEGYDPVAERAEPVAWETGEMRIYALRGNRVSLLWLRDARCDWRTELIDGEAPAISGGASLALPDDLPAAVRAVAFDPWTSTEEECLVQGNGVLLPQFRRSLVLRVFHGDGSPA